MLLKRHYWLMLIDRIECAKVLDIQELQKTFLSQPILYYNIQPMKHRDLQYYPRGHPDTKTRSKNEVSIRNTQSNQK